MLLIKLVIPRSESSGYINFELMRIDCKGITYVFSSMKIRWVQYKAVSIQGVSARTVLSHCFIIWEKRKKAYKCKWVHAVVHR